MNDMATSNAGAALWLEKAESIGRAQMPDATLTIHGPDGSWQAPLTPDGTVVGRSPGCDIVIDSKDVSRQHMRIFLDPFGRWILEDLGSSNGTFVNGKRIETHPIRPGETAVIGPVSLSINQALESHVERDGEAATANIVVEDFETEVMYHKGIANEALARPCPEQLDVIHRRLSEITSLSALYPEVCRHLACRPGTVAAILRVAAEGTPLQETHEVMACHFGTKPDDAIGHAAVARYPSHLAFRVSRRVIDAVRTSGEPVMSKSIYSSDVEVTVAAVDEHSPRAVICAPLGQAGDCVDLLYLDIPIERGTKAADEVFAFGRVVARNIMAARETLAPVHLKSEMDALDRELWLAQQIQKRLAPKVPTGLGAFEAGVSYRPVIWVGGDFCDVWTLEDGRLVFAIGHILDKGLRAAFAISTLRTLLRSTIGFCDQLSEAVNHVNRHLTAGCGGQISGTLVLGMLDPPTGVLRYVNASHPAPLVLHPTSGVQSLGRTAEFRLGSENLRLEVDVQTIAAGGALVTFSQGVIEARSPRQEQFGVKRLMHILKEGQNQSAEQIADSVTSTVDSFRQRIAQQEDMSVLVIRRLARGSRDMNG